MKKTSNQNPWFFSIGYTVIGGVIVVIIFRMVDKYTGSTIISWIFDKISDFFKLFNMQLHIKIWVFLVILLIFLLIYRFRKKLNLIGETEDPKIKRFKSEIKNYTSDVFDGIKYRWIVDYDEITDKYYTDSFSALCPKCNCILLHSRCPNCNDGKYYNLKSVNELEVLLRHRIEQKLLGMS